MRNEENGFDPLARIGGLLPSEETDLGYLFWLSRPRFWPYLAGPVVVGVTYAADSPAELFAPVSVALFLYFLVPANVFLYGVNDAFDADVDEENPKKDEKEVRYRRTIYVSVAVAFSGALGGLFLLVVGAGAAQAMVVFLLLAVQYSAPPLRFKTTPFLDSLSNGLYVLPAVVAYAALSGGLPPTMAIAGGWLWTMGMHTFSAIPDIEPDRRAGIRTTATLLGKRGAYAYCAVVWTLAAAAFWTVHPFFGVLLGCYPVLVFAIARSSIDVDDAYWWYPAVNTLVGTVMTMAGLWVLLYV